jgi:hypothetical protein
MGHLDCSGDGVTPFVPRKQQLVFPYSLVRAVSTGRAKSAHVTTKTARNFLVAIHLAAITV